MRPPLSSSALDPTKQLPPRPIIISVALLYMQIVLCPSYDVVPSSRGEVAQCIAEWDNPSCTVTVIGLVHPRVQEALLAARAHC